jgi:hypothetical protein
MYVKKYDENGICTNPITKDKPFINEPREPKLPKQRKHNNTQGVRCIVTRIGDTSFIKFSGKDQVVPSQRLRRGKVKSFTTITHLIPAK